jgi:uncharacterized protein (DUF488 family)
MVAVEAVNADDVAVVDTDTNAPSSLDCVESGLVSIGYEGRTASELIETLKDIGVVNLIDVRLTPLSRKPGLSKSKLAAAATAAGIRYVHLRPLGNPKDNREPFHSGDVATGRRRFATVLANPESVEALDLLVDLARSGLSAILCFEQQHDNCHRQVIIERASRRLGTNCVVLRL